MTFKKWLKDNPIKWDKSNYDAKDVLEFMQLAWSVAKEHTAVEILYSTYYNDWYVYSLSKQEKLIFGFRSKKEASTWAVEHNYEVKTD